MTNKPLHHSFNAKKLLTCLFICLFIYSFIGVIPSTAFADSLNLSIAPSLFQIDAIAPTDARAPFTISNKGNEEIDLKILIKPFRPSALENGQIEYQTGVNPPIFKKITVVDGNLSIDSLTLGPQQEKKLEIRVLVPEKEKDADYYFSVIFLTSPKPPKNTSKVDEKNNFSTAQGGIATNVLLSIGAKDQSQGLLEEFLAPFYVESGPVPFTVRVKNTGKHFISPKGAILIKNMYGQTIGRVDIPSTNILTGTTRSLIDVEQAATNAAQNNTMEPHAMWNEKFLLGFYRAEVTIMLTDKGPVFERSISFVAFPLKLLFGIIISVTLIVIIYLRVKKRLQNE